MAETDNSAIDLEIIAQGGAGKPELRLWLRMLSTTKLISQEIRRRLRAEFGATLPQFDLLAQLYREREGLRLGELSKRTMVTNGNVTGLVERLEADGLVKRTVYEENVLRVEYEISEAVHGLKPVFQAVIAWSERYGPLSRRRADASRA